jgi:phosphoserine phosphatase RsbU/P
MRGKHAATTLQGLKPTKGGCAATTKAGGCATINFRLQTTDRRPVQPQLERSGSPELEEARILQHAMIPVEPLCAHSFEVACRFRPAYRVGGDFAEYYLHPDRRLDIYLGDVVGKGLPAALYAALAAGMLRGFNKRGETPVSLLDRLNKRLLFYALPGRFCASQYAMLDPDTRLLTVGNAGLPLPLQITSTGCRPIGGGGIPPGMFQDAVYEQHSVRLQPGESVVFYTDGVVEAANKARAQFGVKRLMEVCEQRREHSGLELLRFAFEAANEFVGDTPQSDDMTAIILKVF